MLKLGLNCKCKLLSVALTYMIKKMNKIISVLKSHWNLVLGTLILFLLVMAYGYTNKFIQVFHYDMIEQYVRFIERGYDLIRIFPFQWWDYNHFLGSSIFAYGYYFLFSPFWILYAILPSKELIPSAMLFVNVFKLWALFLSSSYYFNHITKDKLANFSGASIITFSGFVLGYYQYGFYTDALVFLPIALVGVEKFLNDKKFIHLSLSIAVLAIINVYLFMMFTAFIFLYTLFRYIVINQTIIFKDLVFKAFQFVSFYLVGVALASIIFWPNLSLLMQSSRASVDFTFNHIDFKVLYRFITSWLMPVVDRNEFNPFISKFVSSAAGYSGGFAFYSLIISPLLLPQTLRMVDHKHRNALLTFYVFLFIAVFFPSLYVLLQGNIDTRWTLMFTLLNAYTVVHIIQNRTHLKFSLALFTAIVIGAILTFAYIYSIRNGFQLDRVYYDIAKRNIIVLAIVVFLYLIAIYFKSNSKFFTQLIVLTLILEIALVLGNIFFNPLGSISMEASELNTSSLYHQSTIDKIQSLDDSLYRIDVFQDAGYNDPMSKDYLGLTFYSSVYNFEVDGFIQNHLSSAGGWLVGNNKGKWMIKNLLGAKYLVVDPSYLDYVPYGYDVLFSQEEHGILYTVYENRYALPLFYTESETFNLESFETLSALEKLRVLQDYVVLEEGSQQIFSSGDEMVELATFSTNYTHVFANVQAEKIITALFPRSEEVRIQFYLKGELQKEYYSFEPQYFSAYYSEPFDEVRVEVTNLYGVPEEEFSNTLYIQDPNLFIENWYEEKTNDDFVVELNVNAFKVSGFSMQEQYLVSSIAYDKNWKVTINGQVVDVEKINGGFIGVKIPKGALLIEAHYQPTEVYQGALISILGVLYLSYRIMKKEKQ